jgi:hypothetical protein
MHLCYYCTNTDFCAKCFQDRLERQAGKKEPDWRTICPFGHKFIRGPVDGWKGVKDGVIYFGDEKLSFRKWLTGLRDERWPQAWEAYWRRL